MKYLFYIDCNGKAGKTKNWFFKKMIYDISVALDESLEKMTAELDRYRGKP